LEKGDAVVDPEIMEPGDGPIEEESDADEQDRRCESSTSSATVCVTP
jgi:hypothetical protein